MLSVALFTALAAGCAPSVHADTLAAIAQTESRFNPLAIYDNHSGRAYAPDDQTTAVTTASALLAQGHSLDLGLMQINSANLLHLGLTPAAAFDPCANLDAAARLLVEGYSPAPGEDSQQALRRALSRYNTGSPARGLANGYVTKVQAAAGQIVPALRTAAPPPDGPVPPPALSATARPPSALPSGPAAWDVYGQARFARAQAAGRAPPESGRQQHPPPPAASPTMVELAPQPTHPLRAPPP
ncbi:lytic transglycosylase domain-containing protein (plasmid) [Azospirillum sp. TSA2s]|uniref:lytic transglycosylase domain-containing protein n=1 Tax=Azospirillum sp. TSA2s TaxID=709810 RepID=UPI0010AAFBB9|nr:lytic transglycosylase domain-containing protein [Azospirillum sp. TSA2s]QCG93084.1 lytic transglycosylase domain-containing protein [Azospirillum sp. TSA2s]